MTMHLLHLTAVDGNAILTRIAAQLGHHDVAHLDFRSEPDGTARVVLGVRGTEAKAELLAARLRRLVSVLEVSALGHAEQRGDAEVSRQALELC